MTRKGSGELPVRIRGDHLDDHPHGGNVVFNLLAVDPAPPHDPKPYAFGESWWLMVEIEISDQRVLFPGTKCNLRRKRVAV